MRRGALRAAVVGVLVAACGDAPSAADAPVASSSAKAEARPRARPDAATPADLDALVAAWVEKHEEDRAPADALLVAGAPALERLLPLLDGEWNGGALEDLIRAFGPDAVLPLVKLLDSPSANARLRPLRLLADMAGDWAYRADGPTVCRALLARLKEEDAEGEAAAEALCRSRPAGRAVARDLADLWLASAEETSPCAHAARVLEELGPDAADAAPVLWSVVGSDAADSRRADALEMLAAIGVADPSRLSALGELVSSGPRRVRKEALDVLRSYGAAAAPVASRIATMLEDENDDVADHAWRVLARLPDLDDATWRLFVAKDRYGDLDDVVKDPASAARLARTLPTLPPDAMRNAYDVLAPAGVVDMKALAAKLVRSPAPQARKLAPRAWEYEDTADAVPKDVLDLLLDEDSAVRAGAAKAFASMEGAPVERIRAVALDLRRFSADRDVRWDAVAALADLFPDPDVIDALVDAASDPDAYVRSSALRGLEEAPAARRRRVCLAAITDSVASVRAAALKLLSEDDDLDAETRRAVVGALVHDAVEDRSEEAPGVLLSLEGGPEALAAAVLPLLAPHAEVEFWKLRRAIELTPFLAPRVAEIRPALVRLRETDSFSNRMRIDEALAKIDSAAATDPDAIARGAGSDEEKVKRLAALGPAGRRAIVLMATEWNAQELRALLADVPMNAAVVDAAGAAGDDDDAKRRREGAAALAPLLPDAEAVTLLAKLVADEDARDEVVAGLGVVEARSPGAVPPALVAKMLRDAHGKRDWSALRLVETLGPRVVALDPAVVPDLRKIRDGGGCFDRARCAVALWKITGQQVEALPALRAVLSRPERIDRDMPWRDVGEALAAMHLTSDDVAAIVPTLRRAASYSRPKDHSVDEPPGPEEFVEGALTTVVPALVRCGPEAAPAVPAMRVVLAHWHTGDGRPGAAAARLLAAVGPAAREALPDLRRNVVRFADPEGLVAAAIREIEAR